MSRRTFREAHGIRVENFRLGMLVPFNRVAMANYKGHDITTLVGAVDFATLRCAHRTTAASDPQYCFSLSSSQNNNDAALPLNFSDN